MHALQVHATNGPVKHDMHGKGDERRPVQVPACPGPVTRTIFLSAVREPEARSVNIAAVYCATMMSSEMRGRNVTALTMSSKSVRQNTRNTPRYAYASVTHDGLSSHSRTGSNVLASKCDKRRWKRLTTNPLFHSSTFRQRCRERVRESERDRERDREIER